MDKCIKSISVKGKNKRFTALLFFNEKTNTHYFIIGTKTLIDFKKRNILNTNNIYSVETFFILHTIFEKFTTDSEINNKILIRELNSMSKFQGKSNF